MGFHDAWRGGCRRGGLDRYVTAIPEGAHFPVAGRKSGSGSTFPEPAAWNRRRREAGGGRGSYWVESHLAMAANSSSLTLATMPFIMADWPLARAPLLMSFICCSR